MCTHKTIAEPVQLARLARKKLLCYPLSARFAQSTLEGRNVLKYFSIQCCSNFAEEEFIQLTEKTSKKSHPIASDCDAIRDIHTTQVLCTLPLPPGSRRCTKQSLVITVWFYSTFRLTCAHTFFSFILRAWPLQTTTRPEIYSVRDVVVRRPTRQGKSFPR